MALRDLTYFTFAALVLSLAGCGDNSPSNGDPEILNFISGTVSDRITGIPIENAIVKTVPPTEVRLTDTDGRYLVKNSVFEGNVFDVIASQIGYSSGTETVTVSAGGSSGADISIETAINGLVASLPTLQIAQGDSTETFLLSSTLDNTGFSFESSNPAFSVEPSQGTLSKNQLIVIEVKFMPPVGENGKITGQLVANANNGGTPVQVNVSGNVPTEELIDPDDRYAVLVDSDNMLVTGISGEETGLLIDPGPSNPPTPVSPTGSTDPTIAVSWDFESGEQDWGADNGLWEVGSIPASTEMTVNSDVCHEGAQCAGTVLGGNYPAGTSSRWISPVQVLPTVSGSERITLRFWQKFSWGGGDSGRIQLSIDNALNWITLSSAQSGNSSVWSRRDLDLTEYAGQSVQIGFMHIANVDGSVNRGWLLDSISILKQLPSTTGNFEDTTTGTIDDGWSDWGADNGVWEVGAIPANTDTATNSIVCYEGIQCAGTVLDSNYPAGTSSRFVSPIQKLPAVPVNGRLTLRFWQWFSWGGGDSGRVQLSTDNGINWITLGTTQSGNSSVWTKRDLDLTEYADQTVQIGFVHIANVDGSVSRGWFLDEVEILEQ